MSRDNTAVVRNFYEAFVRGDWQAVVAFLYLEVEVYESERLPEGGRYEWPTAGVAEFLGKLVRTLGVEVHPDEFIDAGAGHVVAVGYTRGKVRETGRAFGARRARLDAEERQGGKPRAYVDTPKLFEALEP